MSRLPKGFTHHAKRRHDTGYEKMNHFLKTHTQHVGQQLLTQKGTQPPATRRSKKKKTYPTQIDASDIPAHDILTAGFPCQSFSSAGNEEGLQGDRGILFYEVTRVLKGCRPRAFILENVPNMLRLEV